MTDVELDERVTALEQNGGGGQNGNLTINLCKCIHFCVLNQPEIETVERKRMAFLFLLKQKFDILLVYLNNVFF